MRGEGARGHTVNVKQYLQSSEIQSSVCECNRNHCFSIIRCLYTDS